MFDMALKTLPCLIPWYHIEKYRMALDPKKYAAYEASQMNSWADGVREVVERVLVSENQQRSKYQQVIQEMLDKLPEDLEARDIPTLVAYRFKVIDSEENVLSTLPRKKRPIWATGTNKGQFFILVPPDIAAVATNNVFPYLISREVYHILEHDWARMQCARALISCGAIAMTYFFGLGTGLMLGTGIFTSIATRIVQTHIDEKQADVFASRHCTQEQKEYALSFEKLFWYARQPSEEEPDLHLDYLSP